MRVLLTASLAALAGLVLAQRDSDVDCPTAILTRLEGGCRKTCEFKNCAINFSLANPCGCPAAVPTATLILPCGGDEDCPYYGCTPSFQVSQQSCAVPTTTRWPPVTTTPTTITTRTTSSPPSVSTGITTLPTTTSIPTTTLPSVITGITTLPSSSIPCPTVDKTTYPADCPALRCSVPSCVEQQTIKLPCTCTVHTRLFVQGCPTACADGCATRIQTSSAVCN